MTKLEQMLTNIEKKKTSHLALIEALENEAPKAIAILKMYKSVTLQVGNSPKYILSEIEINQRFPKSKIIGFSLEEIPNR